MENLFQSNDQAPLKPITHESYHHLHKIFHGNVFIQGKYISMLSQRCIFNF